MPDIHIDFPGGAPPQGVSGQHTDGSPFDVEGFVIPVVISAAQAQEWLDLYDPEASASPSAANSRIIARTVLDALKALLEAQ